MKARLGPGARWRLAAVCLLALSAGCARRPGCVLVLATTTSVGYSGVLDALSPPFTRETHCEVRQHLVGSGLAIGLLAKGEADAVISHAPAQEAAALGSHPGWWYRKILFNDFILVGPPADPAGVAGAPAIGDAMRRVANGPARFISRGDLSGTHEREQALWRLAGVSSVVPNVVVAGQGMGPTLRVASETGSYTLTDRGTYLRLQESVQLRIVFEGGAELVNTYAVIADSSSPIAMRFASWLADGDGRALIERVTTSGQIRGFTVWPRGRKREDPGARPF